MAQGPEPRTLPRPRSDRPSAPELLQRLDGDHPRERVAAAGSLGSLGDAAALAVAGIALRLEDRNGHVRRAAAWALGKLSVADVWGRTPGRVAQEAVPELVLRLADQDPAVRRAARAPLEALGRDGALGDLGAAVAPAVPAIGARLRDEDWNMREAAARAIGLLGAVAAPAVPELLGALADPSHHVRRAAKAAVEVLCRSGVIEDIGVFCAPSALGLQGKLQGDDWRVRCAAAWALGVSGAGVAICVRRLVQALDDRDWEVQLLATEALGRLGLAAAPALPQVVRLMHHDDERVREEAREAHAAYVALRGGADAEQAPEVARLLRKLADDDPWLRKEAANELRELGLGAAPALPELVARVADRDFDASVAATKAIGRMHELGLLGQVDERGPEGAPIVDLGRSLCALLDDPNWAVSLHAAEALAKLAAAVAPAVCRLADRRESEGSPYRRAAGKLWDALLQEGAMLELGHIVEECVPVLAAGIAEGAGTPVGHTALSALEKLHAVGLLQDPDGNLRAAAEELRLLV